MLDSRIKAAILPLAFAIAIPAIAGQTAPKISKAEATKIALAAVPHGAVKSVEVEREHGQQVYSFDITVPGITGVEEVQVSAATGKIVEHKHESPLKERAEHLLEAGEHKPQ